MSSSNCCFLTCIQISQEADQVVWYSHVFQNFPQFIVIRTVKGFGIVKKAEIDVFSGTLLLFPWFSGCWQFDLWFFCLWRSSIQSAKTRPGADCGSDHELLIAKFRLKLKKVGKTTRPFRYDLNQIPYDYTVEVRNRFKGLDLINRVPDELWTEVRDTVQETGIKAIAMEKKCKKSKMVAWGGLTNSCEKKRSEKQRRKGKI